MAFSRLGSRSIAVGVDRDLGERLSADLADLPLQRFRGGPCLCDIGIMRPRAIVTASLTVKTAFSTGIWPCRRKTKRNSKKNPILILALPTDRYDCCNRLSKDSPLDAPDSGPVLDCL